MRARLFVLAAALLFSTGGAAIKATTLNAWQVASFRSGVAALALLILLPGSRRRPDRATLLVGVVYGLTMVLFVAANKLTTAANAIYLQSTAPLYILLAAPLLLREPVKRADVIFMLALGAGLAAFFVGEEAPRDSAPNPALGNLLALASGLSWAGTVMGLRWLSGRTRSALATQPALVVGNAFACLLALPAAVPATVAGSDLAIILWLGVVQIGLAYVCLSAGLAGVPALEASLLLLVEPVLNPVWAWVAQGEEPGVWAIAGGTIILVATALRTLHDRRAPA